MVHVHVHDEQGRPTADLRIAGLITEACPVLEQLSIGVGLSLPFEEREQLFEAGPRP